MAKVTFWQIDEIPHLSRGQRRHAVKLSALHAGRHVCYLGDDEAPAADPLIGQAAMANAETAKAELAVGQEQLAWNKERWDELKPTYDKILKQQVDASDTAKAHSDDQWNQYKSVYQPIEERVAREASDYGGEADQTAQAGKAIQDVTGAFDAATANHERQLQAAGVNPADPKYAGLTSAVGLERAKAAAGAGTKAATDAKLLGMSMRQNVANFGRNMPNTSIAQDSSALSAGNAAEANAGAATAGYNAGINSAVPWYAGSTAANTSAGNLKLGELDASMKGYAADTAAGGALGSAAGTALGMWASKGFAMKDGGLVRRGRAMISGTHRRHFAEGGLARVGSKSMDMVSIDPTDGTLDMGTPERTGYRNGGLSRRGMANGGVAGQRNYADGDMVEGPGTSTSDSIDASLSDGEAVLNAEAVEIVGEDFIHRVNEAGLKRRGGGGERAPIEGEYERVEA